MKNGYKQCPWCGEEIREIAKKCRFCGEFLDNQDLDEQYEYVCECGGVVNKGDKRCCHCGDELDWGYQDTPEKEKLIENFKSRKLVENHNKTIYTSNLRKLTQKSSKWLKDNPFKYSTNTNRIGRFRYFIHLSISTILFVISFLGGRHLCREISSDLRGFLGFIMCIFGACCWLGARTLTIKRLHDLGMSGRRVILIILLYLFPPIGFIVDVSLFMLPGTKGINKYGPVPETKE